MKGRIGQLGDRRRSRHRHDQGLAPWWARSTPTASPSSASATSPAAGCARASSPTSTGRCARSPTPSTPRRPWPASRSAPCTPGVAGSHIRCQTSDGVAAIAGGEVTRVDVDRVLEGARAIPVDADRQILHVLPARVHRRQPGRHPRPDRDERRPPAVRRSTSSPRPPAACRTSSAAPSAAASPSPTWCSSRSPAPRPSSPRTRRRSASRSSTSAAARPTCSSTSTAASPTPASSRSAGTTSPTTSRRGSARRWARPSGSKRNFGCALGRMVADDEEIEVPGVGGHAPRKAPRRVLSDIIEPRVEEIFALVRKRIEDTGLLEQLSAGRGAHRRRGAARGNERVRRGNPRHAGANRLPRRHQRDHPARARPAVRDRRGPGEVRRAGAGLTRARRVRPSVRRVPMRHTTEIEQEPQVAQQKTKSWQWLKAAF